MPETTKISFILPFLNPIFWLRLTSNTADMTGMTDIYQMTDMTDITDVTDMTDMIDISALALSPLFYR